MSRLMELCTILTSVFASNLDHSDMILFSFETRDGSDDETSQDYLRRLALKAGDVLFIPNSLATYTRGKFGECEAVLGNPGLISILNRTDPEIAAQMNRMITADASAA